MYTITFYSFKGGVGRTMSLVNVAAELVQQGKRVLIVDFDLEAPGLASFELLKSQRTFPGVVDYVHSYLSTGTAPDVRRYLYSVPGFSNEGTLSVMPAGKQDDEYAQRLNSINWQSVYQDHEGYLMFEDMKAQWNKTLKPDYVLIDSRTGHTDVGGICTRQLPDAVAIIFAPNEQNLFGLKTVVRDIREEKKLNDKEIYLHFVMSNVPDIDDEHMILEQWSSRFASELGYEGLAGIIHYYASLELLDQAIFTKTRPRTRLAREYQGLTQTLIKYNPEDQEGVLQFLGDVNKRAGLVTSEVGISPMDFERRLETVRARHQNDGRILFRLSTIRQRQGRLDDALQLLNQAVESGFRNSSLLLRRAELNISLGHKAEAKRDLLDAFHIGNLEYFEITMGLRLLWELDPLALTSIANSEAINELSPHFLIMLGTELQWSLEALELGQQLTIKLCSDKDGEYYETARRIMGLNLIGLGRYTEALAALESPRTDPKKWSNIYIVFNYAMAEWALKQTVPVDLFTQVTNLDEKKTINTTPNYHQCLAIAFWTLGNNERAKERLDQSRRAIEANPKEEFSAWRYLKVSKDEFLDDLADLETMLLTDVVTCPILVKRHRRSHRSVSTAVSRLIANDILDG